MILILKDILYISDFKQNLISVSRLINQDYSIFFHSDISISRDGNIICFGNMYGNFFFVNSINHQINNTQNEPNNKKRKTTSKDSYLWYLRLGHINPNQI
jgi:hypothetical protein